MYVISKPSGITAVISGSFLDVDPRNMSYSTSLKKFRENRMMPPRSNKSLFYSSNSPLPHLTSLQRKTSLQTCTIIKRWTHMIINTYNLARVTLAHTLSHHTHKKGVDTYTFVSRGGFVMSPSLTSCSSLPHRRRKYGVMSPLAWPRCLKTFHAPPKWMRGRHYSE